MRIDWVRTALEKEDGAQLQTMDVRSSVSRNRPGPVRKGRCPSCEPRSPRTLTHSAGWMIFVCTLQAFTLSRWPAPMSITARRPMPSRNQPTSIHSLDVGAPVDRIVLTGSGSTWVAPTTCRITSWALTDTVHQQGSPSWACAPRVTPLFAAMLMGDAIGVELRTVLGPHRHKNRRICELGGGIQPTPDTPGCPGCVPSNAMSFSQGKGVESFGTQGTAYCPLDSAFLALTARTVRSSKTPRRSGRRPVQGIPPRG